MGGSSSKIAPETAALMVDAAVKRVEARVETKEAQIEKQAAEMKHLERELAAARKPIEEIQAADDAARMARERADAEARKIIESIRADESGARVQAANARAAAERAIATREAEVAASRAAAEDACALLEAKAAGARVAADVSARAARERADAEAAEARTAADAGAATTRAKLDAEARQTIENLRAGESAARAAWEQAEAEAAEARAAAENAIETREAEVAASRAAVEEATASMYADLEAAAAKARAAADKEARVARDRADAKAAEARAAAGKRVVEQEQALVVRMGQSERVRKTLELVQRATRRESPRIKYYFVRADKLRETKATTLPALQSLLANRETRDWIIEIEMNFDDACRGKYVDEYLTVSHRWLTDGAANPRRAPPDPKGVQLAAIKRHLAVRPKVKYVWLDWLCMWQGGKEGERDINVDERTEFGRMLGEINMLYLGCQVLVLLDLSYLSRFWTMYEAWLSRQQATAQGLKLAVQDAARCTIVPILGASEGYSMALTATIAEKMATPQLAAGYLKNDDVSVTNTSDKEKQLAKLGGLDARVRDVLARDAALEQVALALQAEPLDSRPLKEAIAAAAAVGVGDTCVGTRDASLEDGRRVLKALAGQPVAPQAEILRSTNLLLKEELGELRGTVLLAMREGNLSPKFARATGFNLLELKAAGYVEGIKAAGFTCKEARTAGFLTSEAARAGYGADEAKAAGFFQTIEEAKEAGYVEGLKAGGFSGPKDAGFTCEEAKRGGFSLTEIKQAGYSCAEAKKAGYSCAEAKQAGYSCAEAKATGYTCAEVKKAGYSCAEAKKAGYSCGAAKAAGYTLAQAEAAGYVDGLYYHFS